MPRKAVRGITDLWSTHPNIARDLVNTELGYSVSAGSNRKFDWKCEKGHTWSAPVNDRTKARPQGCSVCAGKTVLCGYNDLWTTHPEIAKDLVHPSHGNEVTFGSKRKLEWACSDEHVWVAPVASRAVGRHGCPICVGQAVLVGYNDLWSTHPDLASQLKSPEVGYTVTGNSGKKVEWCCEAGHIWQSSIRNRHSRGCPICANRKVVSGLNDLWTTHPMLATELFDPDVGKMFSFGSGKKVKWKCHEGHIWSSTINNRTNGSNGCPVCALNQTSKAEQYIREGLRAYFPTISKDHTDRLKIDEGRRVSVDMLWTFEGLTFVCEYDGSYWHRDKIDRDVIKTQRLLAAGISVIRVRESSRFRLDPLPIEHPNLLQILTTYESGYRSDGGSHLSSVISEIKDWVYGNTTVPSSACSMDTVSDSL